VGERSAARVLVAETGRDLEILVEARDHQKLLELLRRLRQRVELARMQPRGHEEVARPSGEEAVMTGVWYSRKPVSHIRRRIEATTSERSVMLACIASRRRSR
jgi:hypothetical protein